MKHRTLLSLLTAAIIAACSPSAEQQADALYQQAVSAYADTRYNEAKRLLDSISHTFPTAIEVRREAIALMPKIEMAEQQRTIAYLDSMLRVKQQTADTLRRGLVLEKDATYQDVGNYFYPTQTTEKNLNRSYLRFQVSEQGALVMTSIYSGASRLRHGSVRVSVADGTFAETPVSKDIYDTTVGGQRIEKADYPYGDDGGVMDFIVLNAAKTIHVELRGDRSFRFDMRASDAKALTTLFPLAQTLTAIEQIKSERQEANAKLRFLESRIEGRTWLRSPLDSIR
jgi:hypothetical protein